MKQVNWWLHEELLERLREYQFENRIDSTTEAARTLIDEALTRWERQHERRAKATDSSDG